MTRKRLLHMISALTILQGFAWIWSFLSPVFDPSKPNVVNPVLVIIGTMFLLVGWGLFRRNEFAFDLGFWLWFTSLIWLFLSTVFILGEISSFVVLRNLLAVIFLSILLAVHLFVVIFLGQKETKRIFVPESTENTETSE